MNKVIDVVLCISLSKYFQILGASKAKLWPKCLICEMKNEQGRKGFQSTSTVVH